MSGIDEMRMESCRACVVACRTQNLNIDERLRHQYWTIRTRHGDILGYYNPDEFRASEKREDKVNPSSGTRERIVDNPDWFAERIHHFVCESCADRIDKKHPEFEEMKNTVYTFVSGDVFPRLSRG